MNSDQDVLDSIPTRTVTEERQNVITKTVTNRFAVFGMVIGTLVIICGTLIALKALKGIGFEPDVRIGYFLIVAGIFMFCYFGMNMTHEKLDVVTSKVEKQVPIEGPSYHELKLKEREELIDEKVSAMAAVFEKLALLTSELEEKVIAQENLRIEERKANEEQMEKERLRVDRDALAAQKESFELEKRQYSLMVNDEKIKLRDEYEKLDEMRKAVKSEMEEERKRFASEVEEERKKLAEEKELLAEAKEMLAEENKRLGEDKRRTEEDRLKTLGLSPVDFAWSSNLRK